MTTSRQKFVRRLEGKPPYGLYAFNFLQQLFYLALAVDGDAVGFENLGGDAVAVGEGAGECAVVDPAAAAGGS